MRLILIGPPGGGKGTQAKLLADRHNLVHIATGNIIREAIAHQTPAGQRAKPFYDRGELAPDDLVNEMVAERFQRDDRPDRFVMDGYPRTVAQAGSFDSLLRQQFLDLTGVIVLTVDDEEIVRRISGRWTCPKDGSSYHLVAKPPRVPGKCDQCGTLLVQRDDDKEETVRQRQKLYRANSDLISHYRRQGLVKEVPGEGKIEDVYKNIERVL